MDLGTNHYQVSFVYSTRSIKGFWEGGNYVIDGSGSYSVYRGCVESVAAKPVMIVSDLDGTMVGNDEATKAFKDFWSRHSSLTKSMLVYNTGRCC